MCDPDKLKPEPIPGLPEELPPGERILWQGAPDWKALALHVFHIRAVAIYFAGLALWGAFSGMADAMPASSILSEALLQLPVACLAVGLLSLLAWLMARSTIYTITNERVVIRAGVAIPKAINIPFRVIGSAALKLRRSGNGDIPLQTTGSDRIAYLHMWPHARPWKLAKAEPMLRGIPDAAACAEILAAALAEKAGQTAPRLALRSEPRTDRAVLPGLGTTAGSSA